ncbi:Hsp20/alpha crystallin family protein [Flavihumibacter rivuli]|uniref:Hsp20/alpha crystallin family protein n=1 Tax=Flavihumibacter rivuli TaxID=2838156 RepID=UPI001BDE6E63|nr:Hsp20/alpha crystallin family protein [Flavihumibacter rivuli]ULQ56576.1 Hsp20/alpha crystallin family protein [Flavihumibacter rivuli]
MANLTTTSKFPLGKTWSDWLDMDRIFNDNFFSEFNKKMPAINIAETPVNYQIELVAPGFKKTDFKVKVEDDMLHISAESSSETTREEKNYTRKEYLRNSFSRSFTLPENAQDDGIQAQYEDGILKLMVPKKAVAAEKKTKSIDVG